MTIYRHMDNELANFSLNLIKLRKARGLSQNQLAKMAQIPRTTISSLESGIGNPTLSNALKISQSLHISIDELIGRPINSIELIQQKDIKVKRSQKGYNLYNLLPRAVEHIELERLELNPGGYMGGIPHSKNTKEYFICLSGRVLISIEGEDFLLKKGDCLIFPGDCRHAYRNPHRQSTDGISVIVR